MGPVVFQYSDLANPDADVGALIEEAFGPGGLGICTVAGVPGFVEARAELLPLAARLAACPPPVLAGLEDSGSRYNFGWSCGRETLEGGQPDTRKGSYYANPVFDDPSAGADSAAAAAQRYPALARPNLWPRDALPELECAFKTLGQLIIKVGLLLMQHADKYVAAKGAAPLRSLHSILAESPCPKGRLLHYFAPEEPQSPSSPSAGGGDANWCGWHFDNGSLTGLTSAMYLDAAGQPTACPDPQAGLHIKDRSGKVVQAVIPANHVGFQVGETLQIHSGGLLRGTPHCVVAPRPEYSAGISRETFAVFMQPHWDEPLAAPAGASAADIGIGQWQPGFTFGQHSERTFDLYYQGDGEQQLAGKQ
ncbi:2-oxoglutarate (2OG) and Fe(II)-dependent oxygenase superfamily [Micractinium conductrix]|uniref:2-oxoglutarate (2OG) and Fe(II)-dependent oxygenase superfamily n=1 Tax=Micractinium conductrix TaxID=554055 RepID=A0A2P6V5G8_9CHLO|nr:2-oxoglutarate (2OG) and Fe(II)-dependent oxygenase superfamily [Micractinium conductrix]|eukprot:PSC69333.1 2-oxoglutarate (2OG) and Fe(II)-dependent oxygenase superfamily [Micractinium conductrix]